MPVRPAIAYELLKAVSKLEFRLRRHGGFFRTNARKQLIPDVAWKKVETGVQRMGDTFVQQVPAWAQQRLLAERHTRPMKQEVVIKDGRAVAQFMPCPLSDSDAVALVQAMRQVRNNLFHGGKEDTEEDLYVEDDDWADAATQVALVLSRLLTQGELNP